MKKFGLMALIALFTVSLSVSAQDSIKGKKSFDGRHGQRGMAWTAKDRASMMDKQLDLTDAQVSQLQALFEKQDAQRAEQIAKFREQRSQMQANRDKNREEMRAQREKIMQENDTEIEKIIGKEKLDQWKSSRNDRMNNMRNNRRAGNRMNRKM